MKIKSLVESNPLGGVGVQGVSKNSHWLVEIWDRSKAENIERDKGVKRMGDFLKEAENSTEFRFGGRHLNTDGGGTKMGFLRPQPTPSDILSVFLLGGKTHRKLNPAQPTKNKGWATKNCVKAIHVQYIGQQLKPSNKSWRCCNVLGNRFSTRPLLRNIAKNFFACENKRWQVVAQRKSFMPGAEGEGGGGRICDNNKCNLNCNK